MTGENDLADVLRALGLATEGDDSKCRLFSYPRNLDATATAWDRIEKVFLSSSAERPNLAPLLFLRLAVLRSTLFPDDQALRFLAASHDVYRDRRENAASRSPTEVLLEADLLAERSSRARGDRRIWAEALDLYVLAKSHPVRLFRLCVAYHRRAIMRDDVSEAETNDLIENARKLAVRAGSVVGDDASFPEALAEWWKEGLDYAAVLFMEHHLQRARETGDVAPGKLVVEASRYASRIRELYDHDVWDVLPHFGRPITECDAEVGESFPRNFPPA